MYFLKISTAYCQENTTTSVMPEPTSTASNQPTSMLPTMAPNFGYTYSEPPTSNKVCIKMNASLGLNVTYTNSSGKVSKEMR